jgi:hypothetical protein
MFGHSPSENRKSAMPQTTPQLPDLSVDFMSWLNTELRRHIENPKDQQQQDGEPRGLVNRLKGFFNREWASVNAS